MKSALDELEQKGCKKIIVLPLYPQYAASSTGSVFDAVAKELLSWRNVPDLRFISNYSEEEKYIDALANSVKEYQKKYGKPDFLLMSYHGIPKRYFDKGDNYPCQCCRTTFRLAQKLNLKPDEYQMSFQSRLGVAEWMKEYTGNISEILDDAIKKNGRASLAVSGGSTPKPLFEELSLINLDWSKVDLTLVDDRWVDSDHKDSNELLVKTHFIKNKAAKVNFVPLKSDAQSAKEGVTIGESQMKF